MHRKTGIPIVINFVPFCIHKTSLLERDDLFGEKIKSLMKYFDYFQIEKIDNPIEIMQKFNEAGRFLHVYEASLFDFCIYDWKKVLGNIIFSKGSQFCQR